MITTMSNQQDVACLIREIRDARFAHGMQCPRCKSTRVQRWGKFSGRQRYRCRECGRTYSDLTGTPVAWSKCLAILPRYRDCMRSSVTIRASARAVGVHITTSFRWRHRLLSGMLAHDIVQLTGIVEAGETRVLCADTRRWGSYGRRSVADTRERRSWLLGLQDRTGQSIIAYIGEDRPSSPRWCDLFSWFVKPPATVVSRRAGRASPLVIAARSVSLDVVSATAGRPYGAVRLLSHTDNVLDLLTRFRRWLDRFCGVSSKYLDNYVTWFGMLDPRRRTNLRLDQLFSWPMTPCAEPTDVQQSSRTPVDESGGENIVPAPPPRCAPG